MAERSEAVSVVLVVSSDRGLCAGVEIVIARARCKSLRVRDCAAAERAIERGQPVLILVDPLHSEAISARMRAAAPVAELPVRTSATGIRRLAKSTAESTKWLSELIAERCTTASP